MSNNTVQPAIVVFDKDRTEVLGIAPEGTTDITYLSTISEAQVDAGATAGVATNAAGEMIGRSGSNMGKPVGAVTDPVTGGNVFSDGADTAFGVGVRSPQLKPNNIATRVNCAALFSGGYATAALTTGHTYHHAIALEAPFDAVQLILANNIAASITGVLASVSTTPAITTAGTAIDNTALNNSAGTWVPVTVSGSSAITLPAGTAANPSLVLSDIIPLPSQARTDIVDALPILLARVFMPKAGNASIPLVGNGLGNLNKWGTIPATASQPPGGRTWFARRQDVDAVTTPAAFTDTEASPGRANGMVVGVRYFVRGQVVQTMIFGDSIPQGSTASLAVSCHQFLTLAKHAVSTPNLPVECANFAWASQTTTQYLARALVAIPIVKPDIAFYFPFSPNDGAPTAATITTQFYNLSQFLACCHDNRALPVLITGLPRTTDATNATSFWTAGQDQLRIGLNNALAQFPYTVVLDFADILGNGIASASVAELWGLAANTADGLHLSDAGNLVAYPEVEALLRRLR